MEKYIAVIALDGCVLLAARRDDGAFVMLDGRTAVALLNTPPTPTPSTGIVWRKPGEAGRKHGAQYLVYSHPARYPYYWNWNELHKCWGDPACGSEDTHPWAEINPPSWEGESK